MCVLSHHRHVWPFATIWTVAHQAFLSMGFSRQKYWSELPCPLPRDLLDPGIKASSLSSLALAGRFFTTSAPWEYYGRYTVIFPSLLIKKGKLTEFKWFACRHTAGKQQDHDSNPDSHLSKSLFWTTKYDYMLRIHIHTRHFWRVSVKSLHLKWAYRYFPNISLSFPNSVNILENKAVISLRSSCKWEAAALNIWSWQSFISGNTSMVLSLLPWSARVADTKHHSLGGLSNKCIVLVSGENSLPGLQTAAFLLNCPHRVERVRVNSWPCL